MTQGPSVDELLERWDALAEVLSAERWLGEAWRPGALARAVALQSAYYNGLQAPGLGARASMAARLAFFLPRDLFKPVLPLAELAAAGRLPARVDWRLLDLGAGLGASSFGVALFGSLRGMRRLEVLAIDRDAEALDWMARLAPEVGRALDVQLVVRRQRADLHRLRPEALGERFDLAVMGLALGESGAAGEQPGQVADWLLRWRDGALRRDGSLVVLEPALRERARRLQAARDELHRRGEAVFSPCPAVDRCPLLARPRDWCHEVLLAELPDAVGRLGRAAGLRERRLTWTQLVLRRDGARLQDHVEQALGGPAARLVSGPRRSKGKLERLACSAAGGRWLMRLKREAPKDDPLEAAWRGDWVRLPSGDGARLRLRAPTDPVCWSAWSRHPSGSDPGPEKP